MFPLSELNQPHFSDIKHYRVAPSYNYGGADGTQTHDLYDANVALYQLSYNPKNRGGRKKTRTSKVLLPLVPETSASTNSAMTAVPIML